MPKSAIIEKVRKLLALAGSSNEHEAALAARHVQRLLAEHNLGMADIETSGDNGSAARVDLEAARILPKWVRHLSGAVADAFDCRALHDPNRRVLVFIGVGADAEVASYTFSYLERTVRKLCRGYLKSPELEDASARRRELARNSYYLGAVSAIGRNLAEQKRQTPVTPNALVPVRDGLIRAAMQQFGPVRTVHGRRSYVDGGSYQQGHADGRMVGIRKGVSAAGFHSGLIND